jgi:predicted nucleic acid-binding protein
VASKSGTRLFLDSNVLTAGIVSEWGLDKAVLSICAARVCRMVLADVVRYEVEENLLHHTSLLSIPAGDHILEDYHRLIELADPETVPQPDLQLVRGNRHLIRHEADVPALLSAMACQPDWLLTNNTKHFTAEVAKRSAVRIATPAHFFRTLTALTR